MTRIVVPAEEHCVTTCLFRVVVESGDGRWHARCPSLEAEGAAAWGDTRDEALEQIRELLAIIAAELRQQSKPLPIEPAGPDAAFVAVPL